MIGHHSFVYRALANQIARYFRSTYAVVSTNMEHTCEIADPLSSYKSTVRKLFGFPIVNGKADKNVTVCELCFTTMLYKAGSTTAMSARLKHKHNIECDKATACQSENESQSQQKTKSTAVSSQLKL